MEIYGKLFMYKLQILKTYNSRISRKQTFNFFWKIQLSGIIKKRSSFSLLSFFLPALLKLMLEIRNLEWMSNECRLQKEMQIVIENWRKL